MIVILTANLQGKNPHRVLLNREIYVDAMNIPDPQLWRGKVTTGSGMGTITNLERKIVSLRLSVDLKSITHPMDIPRDSCIVSGNLPELRRRLITLTGKRCKSIFHRIANADSVYYLEKDKNATL